MRAPIGPEPITNTHVALTNGPFGDVLGVRERFREHRDVVGELGRHGNGRRRRDREPLREAPREVAADQSPLAAMVDVAGATRVTSAAGQDRLQHHPLAQPLGIDAAPDGSDPPDRLVTHHEGRDPARAGLPEPVQIRPADGRDDGVDHHVARAGDGLRHLLQLHAPWPEVYERLHRARPATRTNGVSRGGTMTVTARSSSSAASTTSGAEPRFCVNRS